MVDWEAILAVAHLATYAAHHYSNVPVNLTDVTAVFAACSHLNRRLVP
jgi:hypothetical protein